MASTRSVIAATAGALVFVARPSAALEASVIDSVDRTTVAIAEGDDAHSSVLRCTGVLVASNLVLTARHCLTERTKDRLDCAHDVEGAVRLDARRTWVTSATAAERSAEYVRGASWSLPASVAACGQDVALLTLEAPLPGVASADAAVPLFDRAELAPAARGGLTLIGYGATSSAESDRGVRRVRAGATIACIGHEDSCRAYGASLAPSEILVGAGACPGDSGSGAFVGAPGRVVGVLSRTIDANGGCGLAIFSTLEPHAMLFARAARAAFARLGEATPPWVDAAERSERGPGAPCDDDADCAASVCRSGDQGMSFRCAARCDAACPADTSCQSARSPDGATDRACMPNAAARGGACAIRNGGDDADSGSATAIFVALAAVVSCTTRRGRRARA